MEKIGFVGVYDKTDLILSIAKILKETGKKILIVDNTATQKCRYVVPTISPAKAYVTEYDGMDVAVGLESIEKIRQYLGLQENEQLNYDMMLIDTDNYEGIVEFDLQTAKKIYYVSSFDAYSLKRGLEVISQINVPLQMTRLFYSKEMLKEEEEYFDYLALGIKVVWDEEKLYFLLENGDQAAIVENQRISKIKFKNLSSVYKENVIYLVNEIDNRIGERKIRAIIKNL